MHTEAALPLKGQTSKRGSNSNQKKSFLSRLTTFTKDKSPDTGRKPVLNECSVKIGTPQLASTSLAICSDDFIELNHESRFCRDSRNVSQSVSKEEDNKLDALNYNRRNFTQERTNPIVYAEHSSKTINEFNHMPIKLPELSRPTSFSEYRIPSLKNSVTSLDWLQASLDGSRSTASENRPYVTVGPAEPIHPGEVQSKRWEVMLTQDDRLAAASSCHTSLTTAPSRQSSPDQTTVCTVSSVCTENNDTYEEEFIFDDADRRKLTLWEHNIAILELQTLSQDNKESPSHTSCEAISLWHPNISAAVNAQPQSRTSPHQESTQAGHVQELPRDPPTYEAIGSSTSLHVQEFRDTVLPKMHPRYRDSWYLNARIKYLEARERTQWSSIISGLPRFLPINHH